MPPHPRANLDNQFQGPYYGLNLTADPTQLPPQWATVARNIILSDGKIRMRAPFHSMRDGSGDDAVMDYGIVNPGAAANVCVGLFPWINSRFAKPITMAVVMPETIVPPFSQGSGTAAPRLWRLEEGVDPFDMGILTGEVRTIAPSWLLWQGWLYVSVGTDTLWKTNGHMLTKAGLMVPPAGMVTVARSNAGSGGINADVRYYMTLRDRKTGVESNSYAIPDDSPFNADDPTLIKHTENDTDATFTIQLHGPTAGVPEFQNWDELWIYRQNVDLEQPAGRKIALGRANEIPRVSSGPTELVVVDNEDEDNIELRAIGSNIVTGPFSPSRNGVPSNVGPMGTYGGRMYFGEIKHPAAFTDLGKLRFSAIGFPDHVDPDDWIDVSGDKDDEITGVEQLGDQLIVGKRKSIWVVSGNPTTETNDTIATGAVAFESTERTYRSKATVGPLNKGGNGFVVVGEPARVYFASDNGLYTFDGIDTRYLGQVIKALWSDFSKAPGDGFGVHDREFNFTFADDPKNGLLYICCGRRSRDTARPVLVYHYRGDRGDGLGYWTTADMVSQPLKQGDQISDCTVTTIASSFDPDNDRLEFSPITFGVVVTRRHDAQSLLGGIRVMQQATENVYDPFPLQLHDPTPNFEYRSGDIPLVRGLRQQLDYVKFFLAVGSNGGISPAQIVLEVIPDGDESRKVSVEHGASASLVRVVPVQRSASTIAYRYAMAPGNDAWPQDFDPQIGLIGWEPFAELVGAF